MRDQRAETNDILPNSYSARRLFADCINEVDDTKEFLWVAYLDEMYRCMRIDRFEGGLQSTVVPVRAIFRKALLLECFAIVLAHNHPSNNVNPSRKDLRLMKNLLELADAIDCRILDHIIVSRYETKSFRDSGFI